MIFLDMNSNTGFWLADSLTDEEGKYGGCAGFGGDDTRNGIENCPCSIFLRFGLRAKPIDARPAQRPLSGVSKCYHYIGAKRGNADATVPKAIRR